MFRRQIIACIKVMVMVGSYMAGACKPEDTMHEEQSVAVCERGDRAAIIRTTYTCMRLSTPEGAPGLPCPSWRFQDVAIITVNQDLQDERHVLHSEWFAAGVAYHCGTGRIAAEVPRANLTVLDENGGESVVFGIPEILDTGAAEDITLSPDGKYVAAVLHLGDGRRVLRIWNIAMRVVTVDNVLGDQPVDYVWTPDSRGVFHFPADPIQADHVLVFTAADGDATVAPSRYPSCAPTVSSNTVDICTASGGQLSTCKDSFKQAERWSKDLEVTRLDQCGTQKYVDVPWQDEPRGSVPMCQAIP